VTKKSKSLSVPELSPDLLGRVNAKAELLGIGQQMFVIEALEEATKDLVEVQEKVRRERNAKRSVR